MLGYGIVLVVISVFLLIERACVYLRLKYLQTLQRKCVLDLKKETVLRYAFWSYSLLIVPLILCFISLNQIRLTGNHPTAKCMSLVFLTLMISLSYIYLVSRLRTRVVIGVGRQITYQLGSRCATIRADLIAKYSCDAYNFYIVKNDGGVTKLPATLKNAEILMKFLETVIEKHY